MSSTIAKPLIYYLVDIIPDYVVKAVIGNHLSNIKGIITCGI